MTDTDYKTLVREARNRKVQQALAYYEDPLVERLADAVEALQAENERLSGVVAGIADAIGVSNFGAYPTDADAFAQWVRESTGVRQDHDKIWAQLEAMTVEWGVGHPSRPLHASDEETARAAASYRPGTPVVWRKVGPWVKAEAEQ